MALEDLTGTTKFISALNPTWPTDDDWVDEGDNHLRGIKNVLKNTFPNIDGAVTLSEEQLNGTLVAVPESRIINGNFAIDQRNAGAAVNVNTAATVFYPVDRWIGLAEGGGAFQAQRIANATQWLLRMTVGTVDASLAAGDYYYIAQSIEGNNLADMLWGTPGAGAVTFSCIMHSTVAGTFPVSLRNNAATMSYVKTVALAANVSTHVSFTVAGPTSGVWESGSGRGVIVRVGLGQGTNANAPAADAWQGGNYAAVAGCTNLMATAGAALSLADARLYPGAIDYGPCQRLYADELRLCQRYYSKSYDIEAVPGAITGAGANSTVAAGAAAGNASINIQFPMPMRAAPSLMFYSSVTGVAGFWRRSSGGADVAFVAGALIGQNSTNAFNNATVSDAEIIQGHWTASAEL